MAGSERNWHESLNSEGPPPGSSDRAFGLLLAALCGAIALVATWEGKYSAPWWSTAAVVFLAIALLAAPLLGPLNRAWRWFSLRLFEILNPIIMGILFFGVLTPVGIIMRIAGKDPLRLRFEPDKPSYWLLRSSVAEQQTSMTEQF